MTDLLHSLGPGLFTSAGFEESTLRQTGVARRQGEHVHWRLVQTRSRCSSCSTALADREEYAIVTAAHGTELLSILNDVLRSQEASRRIEELKEKWLPQN